MTEAVGSAHGYDSDIRSDTCQESRRGRGAAAMMGHFLDRAIERWDAKNQPVFGRRFDVGSQQKAHLAVCQF